VIKNGNIVCFDVDDTLVMWECPTTYASSIAIENAGFVENVYPHDKHIKHLKNFKFRGQYVIVWSQGGVQWATAVVKALNLEEYVDLICTKPKWFYDDLQPSAWVTTVYHKLEE
jgi:hypothetical protein